MRRAPWCGLVCATFLLTTLSGCAVKAMVLRDKGIAQFQIGRTDEARRLLKAALDVRAADAESLYYMGRAMQEDQFYDQAIHYYQRSLQVKPGHKEAQEWLGKAMQASGAPGETVSPEPEAQPAAVE